ncbi:MAG: carbon-nitrogen hydrolase [Deltaproteobacteria bacterium]|nr:carbon-nitrogen hydrolase [Deltaproteobacteria bacterium]
MSDRNVKICLVQFESTLGKTKENVGKALKMALKAAKKGANIICFPELFNTGYHLEILKDKMYGLRERIDGYTVNRFREFASKTKTHIHISLALEKEVKGVVFNAAVMIDDEGEVRGVYSKNHLFGTESSFFARGDGYPVFDTKYGRVGIMICYDANFPEPARILTLKGAELLVVHAAWRIQDKAIWDQLIPTRALENSVFVAAVNAYGKNGDLELFGGSKVVHPSGKIIVESTKRAEDVLMCDVDMNEVVHTRAVSPYLKDRRPEQYSDLCSR